MQTPTNKPSHTVTIAVLAVLVIVTGLIVAWWITSRPLASLSVNRAGREYNFELSKNDADQLMIFIGEEPGGGTTHAAATAVLLNLDHDWIEDVVAQGREKDAEFTFDEETGKVRLHLAGRSWTYGFDGGLWQADESDTN